MILRILWKAAAVLALAGTPVTGQQEANLREQVRAYRADEWDGRPLGT